MVGNFALDSAVSTLGRANDMHPPAGRSHSDPGSFYHPRSSDCVPTSSTHPRFMVRVASVPRSGSTYLLSLLACLGMEAYGTHHPFFTSIGGIDDLGDADVDVTILLVRNPFDTYRSYDIFSERMRGWGPPKSFEDFVGLWEKTNLHWTQSEVASKTSSVGRLLVLRYEHLLADPVQALSALVTAGLTSSVQLQDALRAVAPAFRPSPPCHLPGGTTEVGEREEGTGAAAGDGGQQCAGDCEQDHGEGNAVRAARNALKDYTQEEVVHAFKQKQPALQAFGYTLIPPGQSCAGSFDASGTGS
jgi:hypothetical protein